MTTVALVGTLDTKQEEYQWLREQLATTGCDSITIDAGTFSEGGGIADINSAEAATAGGADRDELRAANDRGAAMTAMGVGVAAVVRQFARCRSDRRSARRVRSVGSGQHPVRRPSVNRRWASRATPVVRSPTSGWGAGR